MVQEVSKVKLKDDVHKVDRNFERREDNFLRKVSKFSGLGRRLLEFGISILKQLNITHYK